MIHVNKIVFFLIFFSNLSLAESLPNLPHGWTNLVDSELSSLNARKSMPANGAAFSADIYGDGKLDNVLLLRSLKANEVAVFVLRKSKYIVGWRRLAKFSDSPKIIFFVEPVPPGKHKVLCNSSESCGKDGVRTVTCSFTAIRVGKIESATSLYCFQDRNKKFVRYWESD